MYRQFVVSNDHVCRDWQACSIFRRAVRYDVVMFSNCRLGVSDVLGFVEETCVNALVLEELFDCGHVGG